MKISAFETDQLDELMEFLDDNLNENYEKIDDWWFSKKVQLAVKNFTNMDSVLLQYIQAKNE